MTTDPADPRVDQMLARIAEIASRHGWAVQAVFSDGDAPGFAYTAGLARHGLPELLVFALPPDAAQPILNAAARRMVDAARPLHGEQDELANLPLYALPADAGRAADYVHAATRLRGGPVDVVQLVWPDARGRFPWAPGYDIPPAAQPVLGNPPAL